MNLRDSLLRKTTDMIDQRYRFMIENISDIVFQLDLNLNLLYVTPSVEKFRGFTVEETMRQNIRKVLTRESIQKVFQDFREELHIGSEPDSNPGRTRVLDLEYLHRDGSIVWGEVTVTFLRDNGGNIIGIQGVNRDITERKKAEQAIRESEEKFSSTLEAIGDAVRIINRDFEVTWANDIAVSKFGQIVGKKCYEIIPDSNQQCNGCNTKETFIDGKIRTREMRFKQGQGSAFYLVTCSPVKNRYDEIISVVESFKDITSIKEVEERLIKSVHEKESLIKEVHHRVKNNLQAISGLLNIQAIRMEDPYLKTAIMESQNRILSIAMIHEHLYSHHDLSRIDFTGYAKTLVGHIGNSYELKDRSVFVEVIGQTIILNPDTAIPCGLILTELLSNCFKHAFLPGQEGKITVELEHYLDDKYSLSVRDNGKGFPADFEIHSTDSLGMMLVRTFTNLLGGELFFERGEETVLRVVFREYEEASELVFQ